MVFFPRVFLQVSLVSMYFELRIEFDPEAAADQAKSGASSLAALKALRTLRALRPLRAISRWQGMKVCKHQIKYVMFPETIEFLVSGFIFSFTLYFFGITDCCECLDVRYPLHFQRTPRLSPLLACFLHYGSPVF